jgi:flavin-binding protein dodecin
MSVVKFIELSGRSSESFEDAVRQTVERASSTIRNIKSVWVKEFEGVVENVEKKSSTFFPRSQPSQKGLPEEGAAQVSKEGTL